MLPAILRPEQSFPILELIEYRLGGLDMAVCRIGGNPGATFGRSAVSVTDAAVGDMICIIGHPAGMRKRIEAGPTTEISGNLIRYDDIDTLGGNSGSGILAPVMADWWAFTRMADAPRAALEQVKAVISVSGSRRSSRRRRRSRRCD